VTAPHALSPAEADPAPAAAMSVPFPAQPAAEPATGASDPVLCGHCGRTASNGISCIGACVADSGY